MFECIVLFILVFLMLIFSILALPAITTYIYLYLTTKKWLKKDDTNFDGRPHS